MEKHSLGAQSTIAPTLSYGYGPYSSVNSWSAGPCVEFSRLQASSGSGFFCPKRRVCGSTALYSGSPLTVPIRSSKTPLVAVVRYGTIGLLSAHRQVVVSPLSVVETSRPLASAVFPSGTVIAKSKVAKSFGVSLAGNQVGAPCGSLTT